MPIYEYGCKQCGHTLDALQKISDDQLVDCPECNTPSLKRRISAPRFRLKGSGWYETDFKSDNQRNLAKSDSQGESDGGKKSDDKSSNGKKDGTASKSDSGSAGQSAKSSSGKSAAGSSGAGTGSKSASTD